MMHGDDDSLKIVALGGLGQVGMNCLALQYGREILVIDCGLSFATDEFGVDAYYPNLSWLERHREQIRGIVLTHGHQDHIGGIGFLAELVEAPLWAPAFALALARRHIHERCPSKVLPSFVSAPKARFSVGSFEVEPLQVAHSIPDSTGLVVRTPVGTLVHTGDFKLDPEARHPTDTDRLRELGNEKVRVLLSDSTNVDSPGRAGSETSVETALHGWVANAPGRVVVALFASNIERIQAIVRVAQLTHRRLIFLGRSMRAHVHLAVDYGYLEIPRGMIVTAEQAQEIPRSELLIVASGTQAERRASLTQLALGQHPNISLESGDRVVLSSRVIPGNEAAVASLEGSFLRRNIEVVTTRASPGVHVSGHAYRDEQKEMLDLTRPEAFVPIHGNTSHLYRHAALAREAGVSDVHVIENGEALTVDPFAPLRRWYENIPSSPHPSNGTGSLTSQIVGERRALAKFGSLLVTVLIDSEGQPFGEPGISVHGVVERASLCAAARSLVHQTMRVAYAKKRANQPGESYYVSEIRTALGRLLSRGSEKPIVQIHVHRVRSLPVSSHLGPNFGARLAPVESPE